MNAIISTRQSPAHGSVGEAELIPPFRGKKDEDRTMGIEYNGSAVGSMSRF